MLDLARSSYCLPLNLQNKSFFLRTVGSDPTRRSSDLDLAGTKVRTTSINFYEGSKRATDAEVEDALIRTEQYKLGTAGSSDILPLKLQNKTFFVGTVGDEKADFSQTYDLAGTKVRTTTINFYEGSKRATDAEVEDALIRTEQYKLGTAGSSDVLPLKLQNKTFFVGTVGDEKADFSQTYDLAGTKVRTTSINFYEGSKRATDAEVEDALIRTEQYKLGTAGSSRAEEQTPELKTHIDVTCGDQ